MKFLRVLLLLSSAQCCFGATAQWSLPGEVSYLYVSNIDHQLLFQTTSPKVGGCSGRFYSLDLSLSNNQELYSLLLAYKLSGEPLMVQTTGICVFPPYNNASIQSLRTEGDNPNY